MTRSTVPIAKIEPGMVLYGPPGLLITPDVLTSQTITKQRKDKHPLLVLSVDVAAQHVVVTYIASFRSSPDLAHLHISEAAKKAFVPVDPAKQEYEYAPVHWEHNPDPTVCWISVRNKTTLTGKEFKTFDDDKRFSKDTAKEIDKLITNIV